MEEASLRNTCTICQKSFTRHPNLLRHMETHATHRPKFRCNVCNVMEFTREDSVVRHQRRCVIKTGKKIFAEGKSSTELENHQDDIGIVLLDAIDDSDALVAVALKDKKEALGTLSEYDISNLFFSKNGVMPEFFNTMSSTVLGSAADLYQPLPTFQLPQAKFQLYSSLPPQDDTPLNLDSPFREEYYDSGIRYYARNFPLLHLIIWNRSTAHPLLKEALIMRGASSPTRSAADLRMGDEYVLRALRSGLRDKIFREFISSASGDLHLQAELLLAMVLIQSGGCLNKSAIERSVTDGYHSLTISMLRESGLPADLAQWRSSVNISENFIPSLEMWQQWVRYEGIKRFMLLLYLLDALRPSFSGLPPCLLDREVDELEFYLPADEALWAATSYHEWLSLVKLKPKRSVLGTPLRWAVQSFYEGTQPLPEFNHFSSFVIINCLLKAIYESFVASEHDQHRYGIKQALETWCRERLNIPQSLRIFDSGKFTWVGMLVYRLSAFIHDDTSSILYQSEKNFQMMAAWVEEIPDVIAGGMRMNL